MKLITVHGRTRCQFYKGTRRLGRGARGQGRRCRSRSSSTATSPARGGAERRSPRSGADAVMVGRGAQGRPWFPGQLARYLATGRRSRRRRSPPSATSSPRFTTRCSPITASASASSMRASISAGRSMPRPQTAGAAEDARKHWRRHVLTAPDRRETAAPARRRLRRLRMEGGRMSLRRNPQRARRRRRRSRAQRAAASRRGDRARRQDRRRQRRGRRLLRHVGDDAAPPLAARSRAVRQPAAGADRAGAPARRRGQRIQGRSRHAAQSGRARRSTCTSRRCRSGPGHVVVMLQERTIADKMDRQLTHRGAARSVIALAAMLAHEIKNPLSGIRGAAQLLEQSANDEDRTLTRLICDEADRIVKLVDRMEVFGDERPVEREPVNIHVVLDHVQRLAQSGFARHIRFVEEYDPVAAAGARQPRPARSRCSSTWSRTPPRRSASAGRRRDPAHDRVPAGRAPVAARAARRGCRCRSNSASRTTARACPKT